MDAYRDGRAIFIPRRAEHRPTRTIGDGYDRIMPGDPEYAEWDRWLKGREQRAASPQAPRWAARAAERFMS